MHAVMDQCRAELTTTRLPRPLPSGRPPLAPKNKVCSQQRTPGQSTSSDDSESVYPALPAAAVRLEPEAQSSPPRHPNKATRVVKVATDDPSLLDTEWIHVRVAKLRLAMSQLSAGSVAHMRLWAQCDRLQSELAKRGASQ